MRVIFYFLMSHFMKHLCLFGVQKVCTTKSFKDFRQVLLIRDFQSLSPLLLFSLFFHNKFSKKNFYQIMFIKHHTI